jgi:hypothetical protein
VAWAIPVCALVLAGFTYQLYGAWAYHVIQVPWTRNKAYTVTLADHPSQFALSIVFYAILVVLLSWGVVAGLRNIVRNFRATRTSPPPGDGARDPFDRS